MKTYIVYHSADYDGLMSGAICKWFLKDKDPVMVGWDYGTPAPDIPDDCDLYMVDICVDELINHPNLIWIDHHKSRIDHWDKQGFKIKGYRIDGVAACRLCWQWFSSDPLPVFKEYKDRLVKEPHMVRMLGEYDIWDHRDPSVITLQHGLRASYWGDSMYEYLEQYQSGTDDLPGIISKGNIIEKYSERENKSIINERGYEIYFEGLRFVVLNNRCNSLAFKDYKNISAMDAVMAYHFDGEMVRVSMYGLPDKDIDLSKIAVKYGGGGHKNACGFELPLNKIGIVSKGGDFSVPMIRYGNSNDNNSDTVIDPGDFLKTPLVIWGEVFKEEK